MATASAISHEPRFIFPGLQNYHAKHLLIQEGIFVPVLQHYPINHQLDSVHVGLRLDVLRQVVSA